MRVARKHLRGMSRLRATIDSDDTSDQERKAAEEELAKLDAFLPDIHHRTIDEAFKNAKSVRQAIRRVCSSLATRINALEAGLARVDERTRK